MISTREFADSSGFSQWTVRKWCRTGRIPSVRMGREYRIVKDEALRALGKEKQC